MYRYHGHTNLNFPSGLHSHCEIIVVTRGELTVTVNSEALRLKRGMGVFLPGYVSHGFKTDESSECHIFEYDSAFISEKASGELRIFTVPETDFVLLTGLAKSENVFAEKSAVYLLFSHIASDDSKVYAVVLDTSVQSSMLFIAEHYGEAVTLSDAAAYCGVSYSHLSRIFKKSVGITFNECLNLTRVDNASSMLIHTSSPITEIAMLCGFGTLRNFNRVFKEIMGCSPSNYRDKSLNSQNIS